MRGGQSGRGRVKSDSERGVRMVRNAIIEIGTRLAHGREGSTYPLVVITTTIEPDLGRDSVSGCYDGDMNCARLVDLCVSNETTG